jgi:hypothetical protein
MAILPPVQQLLFIDWWSRKKVLNHKISPLGTGVNDDYDDKEEEVLAISYRSDHVKDTE